MRRAFAAAIGVIGLVIATGFSAFAGAAAPPPKPATKRPFSETNVGAMISVNGSRFESVYRVKRSPDGGGAAIQDGTLTGTTYPVNGTDTVRTYFADGVRLTRDTFTLGPPHTDGIGAITGSGKCVGGTGVHESEKCTYTFAGTYDLATTVVKVTLTGTDTRRPLSSSALAGEESK
jgi:hypothetical protein